MYKMSSSFFTIQALLSNIYCYQFADRVQNHSMMYNSGHFQNICHDLKQRSNLRRQFYCSFISLSASSNIFTSTAYTRSTWNCASFSIFIPASTDISTQETLLVVGLSKYIQTYIVIIASILLLKTINLHTFIRSTPLCCCSSSFYLTSCHRPKPSQKLLAWGKDVSPLTAQNKTNKIMINNITIKELIPMLILS